MNKETTLELRIFKSNNTKFYADEKRPDFDIYSLYEPLKKTDESYLASLTNNLYSELREACCDFVTYYRDYFQKQLSIKEDFLFTDDAIKTYLTKVALALCYFGNVSKKDEKKVIDYYIENITNLEFKNTSKYTIHDIIKHEEEEILKKDAQKTLNQARKELRITDELLNQHQA
jgi:hypothetical protein